MKSSFILVPGAWLGGWVWERVAPLLRADGHKVYPITLSGLADRADELTPKIGLMAHVNDLIEKCEKLDLQDAIIVGHSYAGAVVGAAARRQPNRFSAQVYLDTMPLDEGKSFLDGFSSDGKKKFKDALVISKGTRVWPMPESLGSQAPVDGLSIADLELLRRRGTSHPARTFEEPLSGPIQAGPYPRNHAISCVEDDNAAAIEKKQFLNSRPDWTYHSLPICHWPMLSSPKELASILLETSEN
jgi:pimeloyl-ACP methyl ester carboxylesterase